MRWIPAPTESYSDQRLARAGEKAEVLWHRAWAWCGHQETDGFVPVEMVARLCPAGWRARAAALVAVGAWTPTDGGWRVTDWDDVMGDMRSLAHRKKADADRQRAKRQRDKDRDSQVDASRGESRDNPHAEEKRDSPLTPQAAPGGNCNPAQPIHPNCRGCATTARQRAAAAAAEAERIAAADLADLVDRRNALEWCGDSDCDPKIRKVLTGGRLVGCPVCNPDVVVGPLPLTRPALVAVGIR